MATSLRILLITGEQSFNEIQQIANKVNGEKDLNIHCEIRMVSVDVSAFITPEHVTELCIPFTEENYDFALIPGFTTWDSSILKDKIQIPVYKGTRFSGDLYDLLCHIRELKLPTKKAADHLLQTRSRQKIQEYVENLGETFFTQGQPISGSRVLQFVTPNGRRILTGGDFPPLLFAEIVDAPKLSESEIMEKVHYYMDSGANVIDIGMIFGQSHPDLIRKIVPKIKNTCDILVSIDSVRIDEIVAGIESDVDIILSIDGENIDSFLEYSENHQIKRDLGIVLIPLDGPNHTAIENPTAKAEFLISLAKNLRNHGFNNIFYDSLLKNPISPGLMDSLHCYYIHNEIVQQQPEIYYPTFMGLHNVFELVDADSSGMISLLSLIASELNCAGIFTTEFSPKTLGSIRETRKSIDFAYFAKISKSPPTSLGLDAFFVKSKRRSLSRTEEPSIILNLHTNEISQENLKELISPDDKFIHDTTGYFKIYINHLTRLIEVIFIPFDETKKRLNLTGPLLLKGRSAEHLYKTIHQLGLVTEISHAFYLGKELSKAEYALHVNAPYFEDTELE
ncbi:MAG: dihydropteroate synthase [Candidatus Lokiarchaeota archaeon]|nr:dihydropteroate synthase [Candidatus Lokiarchaeota archaeon]